MYDGAPPPPDTPTDITVNNNSVQFQSVNVESGMGLLNLELEWNPVAGNISSYEIRLFELEAGVKDDARILEVFQPNDVKVNSSISSNSSNYYYHLTCLYYLVAAAVAKFCITDCGGTQYN